MALPVVEKIHDFLVPDDVPDFQMGALLKASPKSSIQAFRY